MSTMAQNILSSNDPDDFVEAQLEDALAADSASEKNYHIRQALQTLQTVELA